MMKLTYRQIAFCLISLSILTGMQKARATEEHTGEAAATQQSSERAINVGENKPALAFDIGIVEMMPETGYEAKFAEAVRLQLMALNPGIKVGNIRFDLPPGKGGVTQFTVTGTEKNENGTKTEISMRARIVGNTFIAPQIIGADSY